MERVGARHSLSGEEAADESTRLAAKGIIPQTFILQATIRQMRNLEAQIPRSTNDAGLWRLKGGDEAYRYFLKRYTTTNLTADEIHSLGLEKIAQLEGRMDTLLRKIGRTQGTVNERIEQLRLDLQYPNPASDASRERIIKDLNAIIQDAARRAEWLFDRRPRSPVEARPSVPTVSRAECVGLPAVARQGARRARATVLVAGLPQRRPDHRQCAAGRHGAGGK